MQQYEGVVRAPEINRHGLAWLNTPAPLSLADLRGKIILLDFWTFCCINCMHILPTLRKIEETFPNEVAVIGVHTPKFTAEADIEKVKSAILRYGIRHPVIHDPDHILWQDYGVHGWPTLVFIDPSGHVVGLHTGEPDPIHLLNSVRDAVENFEARKELIPAPLKIETQTYPKTKLAFPAKIKPLSGREKLWIIADSGHNQIVVFDDKGAEQARYGSGMAGGMDGSAHTASFNNPQGLVANDAFIFVADTGNHAIRAINRETGDIKTLAGNGTRGMILLNSFETATGRALASPWDLEIKNQYLFFANAGTHQIGGIDLSQNVLRVIAGNGAENLQDGKVLNAELAQPSALMMNSDGSRLYFVDSETSSLRFLDMQNASITTLVGKGLFDFGHENGHMHEGRLQHPLGLAVLPDDKILVADSYNNTIRMVDPAGFVIADLDNGEWDCFDRFCQPFSEPAGIWADGENRILLVDTNNHRIVEIDRSKKTMKSWA